VLVGYSLLWYLDNDAEGPLQYGERLFSYAQYEVTSIPLFNRASSSTIAADFSTSTGTSILAHGINEATAIGIDRVPVVDVYRNGFHFDTVRYWLFRPWWKVKYGKPTTLPSDFKDDPDLKTIDRMLAEAKATGAEMTFVIAHAPDTLLPEGAGPLSPEKNKLGIHTGKYPEFRRYVLQLVDYILYRSPEAIGNNKVVIEIWNEPDVDTFANLGMSYADVINDIGLALVDRYPGITISANVFPYYDGHRRNPDTERFYRSLDDRLVPHLRASYHLYASYQTADNMDAFFQNSRRLFYDGPLALRAFLDTLGEPRASIPLYIGEHNLHTGKKYAREMAGKEGAAILALDVVNMVRSRAISGHQFYKFTSVEDDGFGVVDIRGKKFDDFPVFAGLMRAVPRGAALFPLTETPAIKGIATSTSEGRFLILVNKEGKYQHHVSVLVKGVSFSGFDNLISGGSEGSVLNFKPYEVKILRLL